MHYVSLYPIECSLPDYRTAVSQNGEESLWREG